MLAFIIILAVAVPALPQFPEGTEVSSIEIEELNELLWEASGSIVNNGPHTITNIWFELTLLKDQKIVQFEQVPTRPSTLRPNITGRFETYLTPIEYDKYIYRIRRRYETLPDYFTSIDEEELPGSVEIVEGSQSVSVFESKGDLVVFYAEIINNTPAYINEVKAQISIYNSNGAIITESDGGFYYSLHPGEIVTYHYETYDVFLEDLGSYEITVRPNGEYYLLPTVVEAKSWGKIKADIGERE